MAAVKPPAAPSAPQAVAAGPLAGATSGATTFVGTSMLPEMEPVLGRLVVLVEDGSEGKSFDLHGPQMDIGRLEGDIVLNDDPYVSPRHARLIWNEGRWVVRDLGSTNGVYARVQGATPLESGDLILLGLQVLQFQAVSEAERGSAAHRGAVQHGTKLFGSRPVERLARLDQRTIEGVAGDVYYVFRDETFIGREVGDIVFTHDPFLSRRHAVLRFQKDQRPNAPAKFTVEDLGSSNGTYLGIRRDTPLSSGDRIRIGQHLFRLDVDGAASSKPSGAKGSGADPKRGS
jgi:pSer/pThr/pTyr-binding forkhead associated (FHA) protein